MFETRKRNTEVYIWRQEVPEECCSEGYAAASFKQEREAFAVATFMMKASREGLRSVSELRTNHYQSFKIHEEKNEII